MDLLLVVSVLWVVVGISTAIYLHHIYRYIRPEYCLGYHLRKCSDNTEVTPILCKPIGGSFAQIYIGIDTVWSGYWDLGLDACLLKENGIEFSTHVSWVTFGGEPKRRDQRFQFTLVDSLQDAILPRVVDFNQIMYCRSESMQLPSKGIGLLGWLCLGVGPYLLVRTTADWTWLKCFAK